MISLAEVFRDWFGMLDNAMVFGVSIFVCGWRSVRSGGWVLDGHTENLEVILAETFDNNDRSILCTRFSQNNEPRFDLKFDRTASSQAWKSLIFEGQPFPRVLRRRRVTCFYEYCPAV